MILSPLDPKTIKTALIGVINSRRLSIPVVITLTDGKSLFGDIFIILRYCEVKEDGWFVKYDDNLQCFSSYWINPIQILFNSEEGTQHGKSYCIRIEYDKISGISILNWNEEFLPIKNMPNPFAKLICKNNFKVAENQGLTIFPYLEEALPVEGISDKGITFKGDELISVDRNFVSNISGGTSVLINIPFLLTIEPGRTIQQIAMDKIKNGVIEKIVNFLKVKNFTGEMRISGFLTMPKNEISTEIEGEECIIAFCFDNLLLDDNSKYIPLIIKKSNISYPIEFLPYIKSELVFYGDHKNIPIKLKDIDFESSKLEDIDSESAMLVRIIGHVNKN